MFTLLRAQTVSWLGDEKSNCVLMCLTSDGRVKGGEQVNIYEDHTFRPRNRFLLLQYFLLFLLPPSCAGHLRFIICWDKGLVLSLMTCLVWVVTRHCLAVLSLPTFRQLLEVPLTGEAVCGEAALARMERTISFSAGGLGTYFTNQNQVRTHTSSIIYRSRVSVLCLLPLDSS